MLLEYLSSFEPLCRVICKPGYLVLFARPPDSFCSDRF